MSISANHLEAVVASLLSVNNYCVEAAWELLPGLRKEGLLDPKKVVTIKTPEIAHRLVAAGYNRGGITDIVAPRLQALMSAVRNGDLGHLPGALENRNKREFSTILQRVPGVGPSVAETAWLLLAE